MGKKSRLSPLDEVMEVARNIPPATLPLIAAPHKRESSAASPSKESTQSSFDEVIDVWKVLPPLMVPILTGAHKRGSHAASSSAASAMLVSIPTSFAYL